MTRDDYPYPEDEFDELGADRVPQGVHRAPVPRWRRLLPFLIVLVLAPTLALVAVHFISDGGGSTVADPPPTTQDSTEPTDEASTEPTGEGSSDDEEESPSDDPSTDASVDLDYSTQIWVLNGAGVTGLAGDTVEVLTDAGWEDANADDYGSSLPTATTLFYDNPDQADEAEAIAELLGIDAVIESSDAAAGDIVIVLRSDFSL